MNRFVTLMLVLSVSVVGCEDVDPPVITDAGAITTNAAKSLLDRWEAGTDDPDELALIASDRDELAQQPKPSASAEARRVRHGGAFTVGPYLHVFTVAAKETGWDAALPSDPDVDQVVTAAKAAAAACLDARKQQTASSMVEVQWTDLQNTRQQAQAAIADPPADWARSWPYVSAAAWDCAHVAVGDPPIFSSNDPATDSASTRLAPIRAAAGIATHIEFKVLIAIK